MNNIDCGATSGISSQFLQGAAALHHQQQQLQAQLQSMMNEGAPPEEIAAIAEAAEQLEAEAALMSHHHHHHQQQNEAAAAAASATGGGAWENEFEQHQHQHQHHNTMMMEQQQQAEEQERMIQEMNQQHQGTQEEMNQHQHQASVPWESEFASQQQGQEGEQHQQQDWAQDFNNTDQVQVFGVEGQEQHLSYEEKQGLSEFNGLVQDLKSGKAEIVEGGDENDDENVQEFMNNNNDEVDETTMERLYNNNANTSAEQAMVDEFLAEQRANGNLDDDDQQQVDEFTRQYLQAQKDQEEGENFNLGDDDEEWVQEYMDASSKADRARINSEYPFEDNNPYLFHENPFEEGINFLQTGVLSEAVLAFEAACQQQADKLEAWQYLGTTQAENEKDSHAIIALNKALALCPNNPTVLLALSASYTNEMMHDKAMLTLKSWLKCDPKFADLEEHLAAVAPSEEEQAMMAEQDEGGFVKDFFFVDSNEHRNICQLFEAASSIDPTNVEIHVALGTLRHLGHEYLKAASHFEEAVKIQPNNEKLWNKLGATLANGQQSERALAAYAKALDINPGFVRAEYNMGIANSNLGRHREAARHFVKAIMLQSGWTDPSCDNMENTKEGGGAFPSRGTRDIWDVLRMSLGCLERQDLVQASWQHKLAPFVDEFKCMPASASASASAGGAVAM